jgi:hypothetical protein
MCEIWEWLEVRGCMVWSYNLEAWAHGLEVFGARDGC